MKKILKALLAFVTALSMTGMIMPSVYGANETAPVEENTGETEPQKEAEITAPKEEETKADLSTIAITLDKEAISLNPGEAETLNATVDAGEITEKEYKIIWTLSDSSLATVTNGEANGEVTVKALKPGDVTITATIQSPAGATYQSASSAVTISLLQVAYRGLLKDNDWESDWQTNGAISGNGLPLEALEAKIIDNDKLGIPNAINTKSNIWSTDVADGATAGKKKGKQIEALKMKLTGDESD